jgi:YidC/Oxa1 family membrane protein insertase
MPDQRNLILAIALSVLIFLGFELYLMLAAPVQQAEQAGQTVAESTPRAPGVEGASASGGPQETREAAIALSPRVRIVTARVGGSIALRGGRIDDLTLLEYRETTEPDSPQVVLLSPAASPAAEGEQSTSFLLPQDAVSSPGPYFADFGWLADEGAGVVVPGAETVWQTDRRELTPETPVTLSWDNAEGLIFSQEIAIDRNYMLTVTRRVQNHGDSGVSLRPFGRVKRTGTPSISGFYILHEGAVGVFSGTLDEIDYDDMRDDSDSDGVICRRVAGGGCEPSTGGWIGITDKYWLTALAPDQEKPFTGRFVHTVSEGFNRYQADFVRDPQLIPAGGSIEVTDRLFAGPKVVELLDAYQNDLGIVRFDLAAAFRWLFFLAKPLFSLLVFMNDAIGNFGVSILLVTVMLKLLFFPLANKSYRSMAAMKKLQPEIVKLKERFGTDKLKMQQETMALYKAEGANPMMGCLPMLIQIPVFFALYEVLFVTIEMRHAPFFGWVDDLSSRDPSNVLNPFGIIPFEYPDMLNIGIWPILMGFSMWLQFRLNPQPQDSIQAKIFMIMPIFFTFILAPFPAGLVIYWTWNNLLSIAQQWLIMRRHGIANPIAK